jgi:hypothetical protein
MEDRLMLAPVELAVIDDLANIEAVLEDMRERADPKTLGGDDPAVRQFSRSWSDAFPVERRRQFADRTEPQILGKDFSDEHCFLRHDCEVLGRAQAETPLMPLSKFVGPPLKPDRRPKSLAFRSGDLVPDPFADDLAFKLGEGEQNIEGEPAHARGRVEWFSYPARMTLSAATNSAEISHNTLPVTSPVISACLKTRIFQVRGGRCLILTKYFLGIFKMILWRQKFI